MGKYSIKELEQLSGIKAHTIRIWEKRYKVFNPSRTETNIRYYSDKDLKKLLNISLLHRQGYKISKISSLTYDQLSDRIHSLESNFEDIEAYIDQLTVCMIEMNEVKFEKLLSQYFLKIGFEKTIEEIIFPFLHKIGILWLTDNINPVQEHFISQLVRQKIIVAIDSLTIQTDAQTPRIILFLPENELHEISLLFYHYLLRKLGFNTFYLGQHVPLKNLKDAVRIYHADYLISNLSTIPEQTFLDDFFSTLSNKFHNTQIYLGGRPIQLYKGNVPENIHFFNNAGHLGHLFCDIMEEYAAKR